MAPSSTPPWPAPGKLNLMLRILGRRADGYHLLQTVFQFIDLCDWLHFEVRGDGEIRRVDGPHGLPEAEDLTIRAARALKASTASPLGVDIRLDKRLPMGGGLGGGSSDAATALVALNRLWGLGLAPDRLAGIGLTLGADVPVFVHGRAAWAEGVGERLVSVEIPEPWYLVAIPRVSVSTAGVFSAPDLTRDSPPVKMADFLAGEHSNDCLAVVEREYPEVSRALKWLARYGSARLTGTGACVFAELGSRAAAEAAAAEAPGDLDVLVARACNRSPLLAREEHAPWLA